jgi:hypothetical protein
MAHGVVWLRLRSAWGCEAFFNGNYESTQAMLTSLGWQPSDAT